MANDGFKNSFKLFKQKDQWNLNDFVNHMVDISMTGERIESFGVNKNGCDIFGVVPASKWEAYFIKSRPGLIFIRNPFTAVGQRYWIVRCLKEFPRRPNKRNVDIDKELGEIDDLWDFCQKGNVKALDKLRWATLGYHHNWDTKIYSENVKSDFPADLAQLGNHFATALGFPTFEAQSAIVNFYHPGSTLSGHVDSSEVNLNAPLLSFSFGQPAVFLIGGKTIDEKGIPLILESGDVLLMAKEARLCYHAVPRILSSPSTPWAEQLTGGCQKPAGYDENIINQLENKAFWSPFESYIARSRINMNIRQVLPAGQTSLDQTAAN